MVLWIFVPLLPALVAVTAYAWRRARFPVVAGPVPAPGSLTLSEVAVLSRPRDREPVDSALAVLDLHGHVTLTVPDKTAKAVITGAYARHGGTVRLHGTATPTDPAHAAILAIIAELGGARPVQVRDVRERALTRAEVGAARARLIDAGLLTRPGAASTLRICGVLLALAGAALPLMVLARAFADELPEPLGELVRSVPGLPALLLGCAAVALGSFASVAASEDRTTAGTRLAGALAALDGSAADPVAFSLARLGLAEHPDQRLRLAVGVIPPPAD
jgi:uncharacterized protein (TIGR04222 family)